MDYRDFSWVATSELAIRSNSLGVRRASLSSSPSSRVQMRCWREFLRLCMHRSERNADLSCLGMEDLASRKCGFIRRREVEMNDPVLHVLQLHHTIRSDFLNSSVIRGQLECANSGRSRVRRCRTPPIHAIAPRRAVTRAFFAKGKAPAITAVLSNCGKM